MGIESYLFSNQKLDRLVGCDLDDLDPTKLYWTPNQHYPDKQHLPELNG